MPKKIDDILNPKPPPAPTPQIDPFEDKIIKVLSEAKKTGTALTKDEVLSACEIKWMALVPPGEGGLLIHLAAELLGRTTGVGDLVDNGRAATLKRLVETGRVIEREDEGDAYFWLA